MYWFDRIQNAFYRLMNVEDELRHDQEEMQSIVKQKQKVIEAQERRIKTLDNANAKLMSALHQLRSVSQTNNNSMLGPLRSTLISPDVAEFKTSSCWKFLWLYKIMFNHGRSHVITCDVHWCFCDSMWILWLLLLLICVEQMAYKTESVLNCCSYI